MKQEKIWDYFQEEGVQSFRGSKVRLKAIAAHFSKGQRILNIGVGGGIFEQIALEKEINIYSIDPSEKAINRLRSIHPAPDSCLVGSIQSLPFDEEFFDGVVASEVLEHLDLIELDKGLKEVRRVLKSGGHFVGTVPHDEDLEVNRCICPECGNSFHRWGHVNRFDAKTLNEVLKPFFEVQEVQVRLFSNWQSLNWKGKFIDGLRLVLHTFGLVKANLNLMFLVSKK